MGGTVDSDRDSVEMSPFGVGNAVTALAVIAAAMARQLVTFMVGSIVLELVLVLRRRSN